MVTREIVTLIGSMIGALIIIIFHEVSEGDLAYALAQVPPLLGLLYSALSIIARQKAATKGQAG